MNRAKGAKISFIVDDAAHKASVLEPAVAIDLAFVFKGLTGTPVNAVTKE